jgi:NAD(P)-dependent dehydrogenase (short-subunit alcohol dehydrogenase family)
MVLDPQCLSGRNAVVVGASSGINLGVAHRLGSLGAQIAIVSRSPERIAAAADALRADGLDVTHHAGDVREATAMQAIMTEVADAKGPIDIVVSGAAGNFFVPAAKMSANAFKTVIDIDLIGTFNVSRPLILTSSDRARCWSTSQPPRPSAPCRCKPMPARPRPESRC